MKQKIQRDRDRVVGKIGHDTKSSKVFSAMVARWTKQKTLLASKGYTVKYATNASLKAMTQLYDITFPDGHTETMTLTQAFNLKV